LLCVQIDAYNFHLGLLRPSLFWLDSKSLLGSSRGRRTYVISHIRLQQRDSVNSSAVTDRAEAQAQRTGRGGDQGGVSFMIQGTTSDPKFVPDVGSVAGAAAKAALQQSVSGKIGGKTGGIFGKRKPN
jgi:hypothetical protein